MLTAEIIQTLSRKNVSENGELTMQRTKEVLKGASRAAKHEIDALAGLKRVSINRVNTTGSISAKIVIAIAQTLSVNPFYLTGEADEKGEFTDDLLNEFLLAKGYPQLVNSVEKPARKRRGKAKEAVTEPPMSAAEEPPVVAEPVEQEVSLTEPAEEPEITPDNSNLQDHIELTEEEAVQILHSLFIQAKYSNAASDSLSRVKAILVLK